MNSPPATPGVPRSANTPPMSISRPSPKSGAGSVNDSGLADLIRAASNAAGNDDVVRAASASRLHTGSRGSPPCGKSLTCQPWYGCSNTNPEANLNWVSGSSDGLRPGRRTGSTNVADKLNVTGGGSSGGVAALARSASALRASV